MNATSTMRAIVAPPLSGKSTLLETIESEEQIAGRTFVDIDEVWAAVDAHAEDGTTTDSMVDDGRVASWLESLKGFDTVLVHSVGQAEKLGLPVAAYVHLPEPVFAARRAAIESSDPRRAGFADTCRASVQAVIDSDYGGVRDVVFDDLVSALDYAAGTRSNSGAV